MSQSYGRGYQGPPGVTGPLGPTGPRGSYTGTISVPTTVWQPSVYTGVQLTSALLGALTTISAPTAISYYHFPKTKTITDINATFLGTNGNGVSGVIKMDINATFITGTATGPQILGVAATTNKKYSLQASGWSGDLVATGSAISIIVSSPVSSPSGVSGTVQWSTLLQINENQYI